MPIAYYVTDENGVVDMRKEQTIDRQPCMAYVEKWDEWLGISRDMVRRSARKLNPVELHLQTVSEVLYLQKQRQSDSSNFGRIDLMRAPFVKSLGEELATDIEVLIDRFESSNNKPERWLDTIISVFYPGEQQSYGISNLEHDVFRALSQHWEKHGYVGKGKESDALTETSDVYDVGNDNGSNAAAYLLYEESKEASMWDWFTSQKATRGDNLNYLKPRRTLSLSTLERIDTNLRKYGVLI
ncbi:uncharacterized protein BXIN_1025 [Babesia sp. Xinjiang]|uniref:uncharacterized protein n=1 Tax=Babesia sp. Xinjiang TaxID=462227 RepID=UPI000A25D6F0|nr:uncharacterized protein BXIN_1025 [Babesia sp. Xinjiang]ORM42020.1 hypothetical protein BXIN_1025 [Babesia sp. Xinjiang]